MKPNSDERFGLGTTHEILVDVRSQEALNESSKKALQCLQDIMKQMSEMRVEAETTLGSGGARKELVLRVTLGRRVAAPNASNSHANMNIVKDIWETRPFAKREEVFPDKEPFPIPEVAMILSGRPSGMTKKELQNALYGRTTLKKKVNQALLYLMQHPQWSLGETQDGKMILVHLPTAFPLHAEGEKLYEKMSKTKGMFAMFYGQNGAAVCRLLLQHQYDEQWLQPSEIRQSLRNANLPSHEEEIFFMCENAVRWLPNGIPISSDAFPRFHILAKKKPVSRNLEKQFATMEKNWDYAGATRAIIENQCPRYRLEILDRPS